MKYEPLKRFLAASGSDEVHMTFAEIEALIGAQLPRSAFTYPAWWSNHASTHVNAQAWLEAGFRTEQLDLGSQRIVFRRAGYRSATAAPPPQPSRPSAGWIERARRKLAGTVRLAPGYDLTEPTNEVWDAVVK